MAETVGQRVHVIFKVKAQGRTRLVVFDTQDLTLGRAPENDLALEDPEMSRKHAVFKRTPDGCRVEDMGTSNGTEVNGESVDHAELSHGDVIRIGEVEITYAETTRHPATLGAAVEYASSLKSFATPLSGRDGEATILGLVEPVGAGGAEDFQVRPPGDFFGDPDAVDSPASAPRDLDAELASLDESSFPDFDLDSAPPIAPATKPRQGGRLGESGDAQRAEGERRRAPAQTRARAADSAVWELDDSREAPRDRPVALTLEIEGLEGEARRWLEELAGKVLQLPKLRFRIKSNDLG